MAKKEIKEPVEQIILRSEHVFMCLLCNRRNGHIRVIDFRTGNFPVKKAFIQGVAQREQAHKVFTLIERDEVSGWQRLGFYKEGTIPGYYKRSDAYVMSKIFDDFVPAQSEGLDDRAVVQQARKFAKDMAETKAPACRVRIVSLDEAQDVRTRGARSRVRLTAFDPFGRHGERLLMHAATRRGQHSNVIGAEFQDCFGNARIEILFAPKNPGEIGVALAGLDQMLTVLGDRGVVSAFAFARVDEPELNGLYATAGFRRTGLLQNQSRDGNSFVDEVLWSRKLASPGPPGPELP